MKRLINAGLLMGFLASASPAWACFDEHTKGPERDYRPSYRVQEPAYSPTDAEPRPERFAYGGGAIALLCAAVVSRKNSRKQA